MTKESNLWFGVATKVLLPILALAGLLVVAVPERSYAEVDPYADRPLVISDEFGGSAIVDSINNAPETDQSEITNPIADQNQSVKVGENNFTTATAPARESVENNFTTSLLQNSGTEGSFNTTPGTPANRSLAISGEFGSRTSGPTTPGEGSFTTIPTAPGEGSFTTASNGGGCTENCGGGGGGGGGGSSGGGGRRVPPTPPSTPPGPCPLYLREFIKLGRDNNKVEVFKLQYFLRTYENLEVPLSGIYDETTYEAVKIFQSRYGRDVLGPWGISEPTGYVFITTRLAINNIYCARTTANNLDLRNFYPNYVAGTLPLDDQEMINEIETNLDELDEAGTSTIPADLLGAADESPFRNFFQAAAIGLVDWLGDWCHFVNLLLLLIIIVLALWIIKLKRELESGKDRQRLPPDQPVAGPTATPVEEGVLKNLDGGDDWDTWLDDEPTSLPLDNLK